jgi:hypothetical protein
VLTSTFGNLGPRADSSAGNHFYYNNYNDNRGSGPGSCCSGTRRGTDVPSLDAVDGRPSHGQPEAGEL